MGVGRTCFKISWVFSNSTEGEVSELTDFLEVFLVFVVFAMTGLCLKNSLEAIEILPPQGQALKILKKFTAPFDPSQVETVQVFPR
jgi:hypothetical protein